MNKKIALCFLLGAAIMLAADRNYKRVECDESIEALLEEKADQQPLLSTSDQSMQMYVNQTANQNVIPKALQGTCKSMPYHDLRLDLQLAKHHLQSANYINHLRGFPDVAQAVLKSIQK